MLKNEKKNKSAIKKSAYSSKIHDFINKLLDSPERETKDPLDKCNTHPKKEESKMDLIFTSKIHNSQSTYTTADVRSSPNPMESNEIELFESSFDNLTVTPCEETVEKVSFEKNFFSECLIKKYKLSDLIKKDFNVLLDIKLQRIMKDAMDTQTSSIN